MRITADLGALIRNLRETRGITRSELAERSEVSISHLEKIEAGQRSPGMSTFIKVMLVLDVNISLSGTGNTIQEKMCCRCTGHYLRLCRRRSRISGPYGGMYGK